MIVIVCVNNDYWKYRYSAIWFNNIKYKLFIIFVLYRKGILFILLFFYDNVNILHSGGHELQTD